MSALPWRWLGLDSILIPNLKTLAAWSRVLCVAEPSHQQYWLTLMRVCFGAIALGYNVVQFDQRPR